MKKTYVKPELDVIEFDLGEAIAASQCVAQVYNHDRTSCQLLPRLTLSSPIWIPQTCSAKERINAVLPLKATATLQ